MTAIHQSHFAIALSLILLLAGCTTNSYPGGAPIYTPTPPATVPTQEPDARPDPGVTIAPAAGTAPAGKAVASLLEQAWQYYRNDNTDSAIAVAERALRLDARSGEAYLVLASSYLRQGQQALAKQFARRGLVYSPSGSSLSDRLQEF